MNESIGLDPQDLESLQTAQGEIERKLMRLRAVEPQLLDLSLREPVTGSPLERIPGSGRAGDRRALTGRNGR